MKDLFLTKYQNLYEGRFGEAVRELLNEWQSRVVPDLSIDDVPIWMVMIASVKQMFIAFAKIDKLDRSPDIVGSLHYPAKLFLQIFSEQRDFSIPDHVLEFLRRCRDYDGNTSLRRLGQREFDYQRTKHDLLDCVAAVAFISFRMNEMDQTYDQAMHGLASAAAMSAVGSMLDVDADDQLFVILSGSVEETDNVRKYDCAVTANHADVKLLELAVRTFNAAVDQTRQQENDELRLN